MTTLSQGSFYERQFNNAAFFLRVRHGSTVRLCGGDFDGLCTYRMECDLTLYM